MSQKNIDIMFSYITNQGPLDFPDDCKAIQRIIQKDRGVFLSIAEVFYFWHWHSNQMDGCFLSVPIDKPESVTKAFDEFYNDWWNKNK